MTGKEILTNINECKMDSAFAKVYGDDPEQIAYQRKRYTRAIEAFESAFSAGGDAGMKERSLSIFSAPGRTEIGGNHTDHQQGKVLAAAVDLDAIAIVAPNGKNRISLRSEGYDPVVVDLQEMDPKESEKGTTASLVRGVAAQFVERGARLEGLDMYITSDVLSGSGLSSSAAFEVLIGTILDVLFNEGRAGAQEIAKIGRKAENLYFGKACGLMDQMVSSVGGLLLIDFSDQEKPYIDVCQYNENMLGFTLIITDTKGNHADLSDEYSAIPEEMESVAHFFGRKHLRQVRKEDFYRCLARLRMADEISDRAILRSAHFFEEDERVEKEAVAWEAGDIEKFFFLLNESGESSAMLLQNLYCTKTPKEQAIPVGLLLSRRILGGRGACRVHGGGFAGTIQAFVPDDLVEEYTRELESVFGTGACHILKIRACGGMQIL